MRLLVSILITGGTEDTKKLFIINIYCVNSKF